MKIEDELTKILSEELAKNIDSEIINNIYIGGIKDKLNNILKRVVRNNKIDSILNQPNN